MTKYFMTSVALLVAAGVGCSKSSSHFTGGVACDAAAIDGLAKDLKRANGFDVNLQDPKVQADIAEAKKTLVGKQYTFTGCLFSAQGNDEVLFAPSTPLKDDHGNEVTMECTMKGGVEGVSDFRHKAMKMDRDKLRLDVRGQIAIGGDERFQRLALRNCEIAVHE